ncbi:MAG: hypothetical protein ACRDF9_02950 [Candidatus Limnocylindria bacterium]
MRRPISRSAGARLALLLAGATSAALAASQTAAGQSRAGGTSAYAIPRTPWGDPDLQGVWPVNNGVPMQRAVDLGERATLTDEEFARREAQARAQAAADAELFVGNTPPAGRGGGAGIGPPAHWLERGIPTRETSLIIDPPNGRLPALTAEAEKRRTDARGGRGPTGEWRGEADSYEDLNIYYRCITRGVLGSMIPVIYGNGNQIVQAPGYVVLRQEMIHESRVIPLDGRTHVSPGIRLYMGDSRGRWEGDTLVVETTNFTDKVAIGSNGAGYPGDPGHHSEALRLVERFTRTGENALEYVATVEDPRTWTRPWTMRIRLTRSDDYQVHEYACHEGNYAMRNILSGARAEDAPR